MIAAARMTDPSDGSDDNAAPERRCIATGAVGPKEGLIRFVAHAAAPTGPRALVPDLEERLPGRGLWIAARRDIVSGAVAKNLFAKAARAPVTVPADLADRLEGQLARRCVDILGLARRAGQAVAGFEQARAWLERGRAALLVAAADGSAEGRRKLGAAATGVPTVMVLSGQELGMAFGRDHVGHVALAAGRLEESFRRETGRLAGFRAAAVADNDERMTTDG